MFQIIHGTKDSAEFSKYTCVVYVFENGGGGIYKKKETRSRILSEALKLFDNANMTIILAGSMNENSVNMHLNIKRGKFEFQNNYFEIHGYSNQGFFLSQIS